MRALELILILLAVAAFLYLIAERLLVPFPSLLVIGGLALSLVPGIPTLHPDPDVILLIFIPPLIYWASLTLSYRDFRRNIGSITLLGVGLVLMTMTAVASVAHFVIPDLTWGSAFVLGAVVSPPDAIAVRAITRRLRIPERIVIILEGESLVNDATAFVAYRMAVAAVVVGTFSIWEAGLRFLWMAAGGIALGLFMGWLVGSVRQIIGESPVVENTISLLTPFAVYIPADHLGLSSVLAVVATGIYLSRRAPKIVSASTRLQNQAMWEILNFVLEGLIFILVGLELPVIMRAIELYALSTLLKYTVIISVVLILVRIAWVLPNAYLPILLKQILFKGKKKYPPLKHLLFMGWAGVRGGTSLVIALALPLSTARGAPFPGRSIIILLTFAVILVTLVFQSLTFRPLIHLLGLQIDLGKDPEETAARLKITRAGLARLDDLKKKPWATSNVVRELRDRYQHRAHRLGAENDDANDLDADMRDANAFRLLRLAMIDAEREESIRLRDADEINDDALRRIQSDLDHEEVPLSHREEDETEASGTSKPMG